MKRSRLSTSSELQYLLPTYPRMRRAEITARRSRRSRVRSGVAYLVLHKFFGESLEEVQSLNSASADCGQGSGRQFDNMAPCCGQGYSTTPVDCYSTVFHVFHDSDRIGTYCHGSGALDSASACATKGQVYNVIERWSGCRATQPSRRPRRAAGR